MSRSLLAIVGPTASGKSAVAMRLAEELDGAILSCDSMQVYRGLDVGTAKPSVEERARVPHFLIDVADPNEEMSAARFSELAEQAMEDWAQKKRGPLFLVGGTGLYLRALRQGLADLPAADAALRERLYAAEAAQPGVLRSRLEKVDASAAAKILPNDTLRLVRALEIFELTGQPMSAHFEAQQKKSRPRDIRVAVLDPPMAELKPRIVERAEEMLKNGIVDETRRLIASHGENVRVLLAVGYRQCHSFLRGTIAEAQLRDEIVSATVKYARRQKTWFRKEPDAISYSSAEALWQKERANFR